VGVSAAKMLALALNVPLIDANHIEAHIYACSLAAGRDIFPCVGLVVSGGHTVLFECRSALAFVMLGGTIDDAAGEAFDKVASVLGLGFPGGPNVEREAATGNPQAIRFPRSFLHESRLDFSFSGLKTAVLTVTRERALDDAARADLAAEIEAAIVEVLAAKALAAMEHTGLRQLVVAGGVGANLSLRARLTVSGRARGVKVFYPELEFCTDNGAMIAFAAAKRLESRIADQESRSGAFTVRPRWDLETLATAG
jgi:tRNA N6-adenosine threonylcarbamoyltransferase